MDKGVCYIKRACVKMPSWPVSFKVFISCSNFLFWLPIPGRTYLVKNLYVCVHNPFCERKEDIKAFSVASVKDVVTAAPWLHLSNHICRSQSYGEVRHIRGLLPFLPWRRGARRWQLDATNAAAPASKWASTTSLPLWFTEETWPWGARYK